MDEYQLKINLKKQPIDKKEDEERITEKTKITVQTLKKKIVTKDEKVESIDEIIEQPKSEEEELIQPRKITVESIQNEVDVSLRPKQGVKIDSKKTSEISEVLIDDKRPDEEIKEDQFKFKPSKKEFVHTFEKDGDKISTIESEKTTDLHTKITIETKKEKLHKEESEIEKPEESSKIISSEQEIEDGALSIERIQNIDTQIELKSKKKPKFVERFDLKPGKTEPFYNIAKEESLTELCTEKTDELDQPHKLEKHASTSIENLKTVGVDLTKSEEKETELKIKKKKRVKIIIPTKEARQLNEADQSIIASEIKADKYYEGE